MSTIYEHDLDLLISIEPYYLRMYYAFYTIKNILFWTIFILLMKKSASNIKEYRYYLCINIISSYIFGTTYFIWQPLVIMPDTYLCSKGPLGFGKLENYVLLYILVSALLIHITGIVLCLIYQLANAELGFLNKVFSTEKIPTIGFVLISMLLVILVDVLIYLVTNDETAKNLTENNTLNVYLSKFIKKVISDVNWTQALDLGSTVTPVPIR
jgi:hypothetical protein